METSARDYHQRKVKSNKFVSSEMRKQILRLQDKLGECESGISRHSNEIEEIQDALTIAQECVQCLLSEDPFEAWKDYAQRKEEEDDALLGLEDCRRPSAKGNKNKMRKTHLAKRKVAKSVTPEMRQRIDELKSQLEDYATCVRQTLRDICELGSLSTALELACSLQGVDSLESPKARRKEIENEDGALLDSL